ncbi:hypothetical protein CDD81_2590 [Ophiocordyceps australis]|uniref:Choline transport protein n=1 Tax=Ophiocordyceps australis TaxID=1399860 RepID=A0A2C5XWI8_9HYPO|nr:hypothetical protein CDD81_2590 [Ophiocordyceps australis]
MKRDKRAVVNSGDDAAALASLGHAQELRRSFSPLALLGLAFAILNSWTALAAASSLALPSGGTSAVLWGLVVAGVCNLCLAASLAEFLSAWPTAGGQYHWVALVAPQSSRRALSFVTGWISVCGWVALSASAPFFCSSFVGNIVAVFNGGHELPPWQTFLLYVGFTSIGFVVNAFGTGLLPLITKAAFYWSMAGFVVMSITVLACAAPNFQSAAFVYGEFRNSTGWPDGLAWLIGLLQGAFALTGFDAVAHMIEEIPEPQVEGPRIMLVTIVIGVVTGFISMSCLLFCLDSVEGVIESKLGPLLQMLMDATESRAGSVCLLLLPIVCLVFTSVMLVCTSSRMTWAFARDGGMPLSHVFARVHARLGVPLNALLWTQAWVIVFGCVNLGSTSGFSAITSASVVALGVTYAIPPAVNMARGRRMLPASRAFRLSETVGWMVNAVGILWTVLTTVLFVFPPNLPTTASNMNYCIVAFGVMLCIACLTWLVDGRKHYQGPRMDRELLQQASMEETS